MIVKSFKLFKESIDVDVESVYSKEQAMDLLDNYIKYLWEVWDNNIDDNKKGIRFVFKDLYDDGMDILIGVISDIWASHHDDSPNNPYKKDDKFYNMVENLAREKFKRILIIHDYWSDDCLPDESAARQLEDEFESLKRQIRDEKFHDVGYRKTGAVNPVNPHIDDLEDNDFLFEDLDLDLGMPLEKEGMEEGKQLIYSYNRKLDDANTPDERFNAIRWVIKDYKEEGKDLLKRSMDDWMEKSSARESGMLLPTTIAYIYSKLNNLDEVVGEVEDSLLLYNAVNPKAKLLSAFIEILGILHKSME